MIENKTLKQFSYKKNDVKLDFSFFDDDLLIEKLKTFQELMKQADKEIEELIK